jgi:hypothetical protein
MRSYLHLSRADDPYRVRARAALWEWEEKLGRHEVKDAAPKRLIIFLAITSGESRSSGLYQM